MSSQEVLVAVIASTKSHEHWITSTNYYHEYAGIRSQGKATASPETIKGCPPPNSYEEYPIVGLWVIPHAVADDIDKEAGRFKRFNSKQQADAWLTQNGAKWVGSE